MNAITLELSNDGLDVVGAIDLVFFEDGTNSSPSYATVKVSLLEDVR